MLDRRHKVLIVLIDRIEEFERACIKRCVETSEGGRRGGVGWEEEEIERERKKK